LTYAIKPYAFIAALDKEGIFRISGDALDIEAYKQAFDNNEVRQTSTYCPVHPITSRVNTACEWDRTWSSSRAQMCTW
jgi:hypothetical protein